jgi:hypothetical protein
MRTGLEPPGNCGVVSAMTILEGSDGSLIGEVADLWMQGVGSEIEEADETHMVFALSNRGVSFVHAATPGTLNSTAPVLAATPSVAPSEGPLAGGTAVAIAGLNFTGDVHSQSGANRVDWWDAVDDSWKRAYNRNVHNNWRKSGSSDIQGWEHVECGRPCDDFRGTDGGAQEHGWRNSQFGCAMVD